MRKLFYIIFASIVITGTLNAQTFSVENYKKFLKENETITASGLYTLYDPGLYNGQIKPGSGGIHYLDSMQQRLNLTSYENLLINQHGFMVSERLSDDSYYNCLVDIYNKDLPLFISSDLFLHAIHMSYDAILKQIEVDLIIPRLKALLEKEHTYLAELDKKYKSDSIILQSLKDYDVYFTVARKLLAGNIEPYYQENKTIVTDILSLIDAKQASCYPLFSTISRNIDFSQFTVRGHYTDKAHPELANYFQCMIWLGRTELYLIPPESLPPIPTKEDIRRQIIDSYLMLECTEALNLWKDYDDIDKIIISMVGESDNVKLNHLKELKVDAGFSSLDYFVSLDNCEKFQKILSQKEYAGQKILSQILMGDPMQPDFVKPASAFMLFGQRFIIDSYVTGNVVHDKVYLRMLPSSLDILFALGNNAAGDFLERDLEVYKYSSKLGALRYLIDSYGNDFWTSSIYNNWLNILRTLNSPSDEKRKVYPEFMKTAAWWQEKMNTQLSSWAQLRHDNLLYAKQSYTAGIGCSFPNVYVEPIPEFFNAVNTFAINSSSALSKFVNGDKGMQIKSYFDQLSNIAGKLKVITEKELKNECLTDDENTFLKQILTRNTSQMCGEHSHNGWFNNLFFDYDDVQKPNYIVADVHTAPTDQDGNPVGWVLHVGTGKINIGVFITRDCQDIQRAYAGPVMSYLEHTSTNFKRLTDEEWELIFKDKSDIKTLRPPFVDLYLADKKGNSRSVNPVSLPLVATSINEKDIQKDDIILSVMPNPFNETALVSVSIPVGTNVSNSTINIYDENGNFVRTLFRGSLPAGNYTIRWDGTDASGIRVMSGVYLYKLENEGKIITGKIILNR